MPVPAYNALKRCASCVLQSGVGLRYVAVQDLVGHMLDRVVHIKRWGGCRQITDVLAVDRLGASSQRWDCRSLLVSATDAGQTGECRE